MHRLAAAALVLAGCGAVSVERGSPLAPLDKVTRLGYLDAARLWLDSDVAGKDLRAGPAREGALAPNREVACDFTEPSAQRLPPVGSTPKFYCQVTPDDLAKVKFGQQNGEVYGEMLSSRLLWALGLGTDDLYAVRLTCRGCPADPWRTFRRFPRRDDSPRATRRFDAALIERVFGGHTLQECTRVENGHCTRKRAGQGWSWRELARVRDAAGPDRRAEIDAFRLLAAFIQHGDDKPSNHRLVCLPDGVTPDGRCTRTFALISDLGSTFGRGASRWLHVIDDRSRPTLTEWRRVPLWRDARKCQAQLQSRSFDSDPVVSEAGRSLLAARFARLSEGQIRDLFVGARIVEAGERIDGRAVTVEDWMAAFLDKRAQLLRTRCPN